jgi:hypothetical protein
MQQQVPTSPIRQIPPPTIVPNPHQVHIVGITLPFGDVLNLVILFLLAQLLLAAIVGVFGLLFYVTAIR